MKSKLLSVLLIFVIPLITKAQNLPTPIFTMVPCEGVPGVMDTLLIAPVPGATSYLWETSNGQENSILFNGAISPVYFTSNYMELTFMAFENPWDICVTAFSSCCSSATACTTIFSIDSIMFDPSNSITAPPNSSGNYSLEYLTCTETSSSIIYWTLTGDITFINGQQNQMTPFNYNSAQLNFGSGFTNGTLCAYSVNGISLSSDTICMTITAPVGIIENSVEIISCFIDSKNDILNIKIPKLSKPSIINIYNSEGKLNYESIINEDHTTHSISTYKSGIYFVSIIYDNNYFTRKILIQK